MKLSKIKILVYLASMLVVLGLALGCNGDDDDNGYGTDPNGERGENEVWMQSIAFVPESITVSVGTTITWTNKDNVAHTVTSGTPDNPTGTFDSGNMTAGETFSFTFDTAGTFVYFCQLHPTQMTGTVIVQ